MQYRWQGLLYIDEVFTDLILAPTLDERLKSVTSFNSSFSKVVFK